MPMKIALLGYGTVARGVHKILKSSVPQVEVARVFCLPNEITDPELMTSDYDELLATPGLQAVVEAMGGIDFAFSCISAAMERGLHVVTSNKAVVAAHFSDFAEISRRTGAALLIEATVGGGIPWIHNLERAARIDEVKRFSGILNGTTNYIIDQMLKTGAEFDDVLADAQRLGYAEADPSADIDGTDVWNKTIISASVAFNVECCHDVPAWGISTLTKKDLKVLGERGYAVKLMGRGVRSAGRYAACVSPVVLSQRSVEANVPDNYNVATLTGKTIGVLKFYGQGAGGDPTGNAVVQDLIDLADGKRPSYDFSNQLTWEPKLLTSDWIIRTTARLRAGDAEFAQGYKVARGIDPVGAQGLYRRLVAEDPTTFMAALPENFSQKFNIPRGR